MSKHLKLVLLLIISLAAAGWSCRPSSELEWTEEEGYRWAPVDPGFWEDIGFSRLDPNETGITFVNTLSDSMIAQNRNLQNGSGVAAGDVNGDGLVDLYFAGLEGDNRLYLNHGGFRFEDVTEQAGVAHREHYATGVVMADVDGDSDLDLLVASHSDITLYNNDGSGVFERGTQSDLDNNRGGTTMALADIEGDGDLDLYLANYKDESIKDLYNVRQIVQENITRKVGGEYVLKDSFKEYFTLFTKNGQPDTREHGEIDQLFINDGDGTFTEDVNLEKRFLTSDGEPLGLQKDWGLTARFQDINGDGHPDLYVCNDFWTQDRIWINRGDGTFEAANYRSVRNFSYSSMGVDFSDINRDGHQDFFVVEMLSPNHTSHMQTFVNQTPYPERRQLMKSQPLSNKNSLYLNRGDQTFAEIAYYAGVQASGWSWATHFLDADLNGYEDIFITTGYSHNGLDLDSQREITRMIRQTSKEVESIVPMFPPLILKNVVFKNNGDLTFTNQGAEWGFDDKDISHGMASVDLDNDGDLDIVTNRLNQPAGVYENKVSKPRIAIRLQGRAPNTQAIGAEVRLLGGPVTQSEVIVAGGNYMSGSDPLVMFAASEDKSNHTIEVSWPDGDSTRIENVSANRIYEVQEPEGERKSKNKMVPLNSEPIFTDISQRIDHQHKESDFTDFKFQPLLPRKMSELGPGVTWLDTDRDGDDDLLIGAAKGGDTGYYINDGSGNFEEGSLGLAFNGVTEDQSAITGWNSSEGTNLIVGESNYEREYSGSAAASIYGLKEGYIENSSDIPPVFSSTGPIAASDYDADGDLDLFVGGRFVPGYYPMSASSRLFLNKNGTFTLDQSNSPALDEVGMVTGAVFTDYDRDGDPDLILSTEWGAIKLYRNVRGEFREVTTQVGLQKYQGFWNGVATGDFNNDGLPDIVATNIGLNNRYRNKLDRPLRVYFEDFDRDRSIEVMESYHQQGIGGYVPLRPLTDLDQSLQAVTKKIQSYSDFAHSTVGEVMGMNLGKIPYKEVNTLGHMIFINQGDSFEGHLLPAMAQWSTGYNISVADYNNDGYEDLFMTQNFFGVPSNNIRQDAGRGLWLRGDGTGQFEPLPGIKSGIKVYGEQRGAALADINNDGRIDLAISQNNHQTKLYQNNTDKAGISVSLVGPEKNLEGFGSAVQLQYPDGTTGPLREIQAGSGYWSQHSATQVVGYKKLPASIKVYWFDGTSQQISVKKEKTNYRVLHASQQ